MTEVEEAKLLLLEKTCSNCNFIYTPRYDQYYCIVINLDPVNLDYTCSRWEAKK